MTPHFLLTVAVVVTLTAGAVVVVSSSRVGNENYNIGSDTPPPPQVSAVCSQHHRTTSVMHGLTRSWQNTSTVPQIVSTAYDFLESHQLTGTKWGLPFHFYRPSLQKCTHAAAFRSHPQTLDSYQTHTHTPPQIALISGFGMAALTRLCGPIAMPPMLSSVCVPCCPCSSLMVECLRRSCGVLSP